MNVYIIIESKSEDYHGTYNEIVEIYSDREIANQRLILLYEANNDYNTEYRIDTYSIKTEF